MTKHWPQPWPANVVLLRAWSNIVQADWGYEEKKRWVVFSPDYPALAYYRANPEVFGEISASHVRVLLMAIQKLNMLAVPQKRGK